MRKVHVAYVLPSRYDDEGYVNRYVIGLLPSNTLTCLQSLTVDAARTGALGPDIDVSVSVYDDAYCKTPFRSLARQCARENATLIIGLVGVQSNQFPRACDLVAEFRHTGARIMMGGFHISGVMALFNEPDDGMKQLMSDGVTLVAGEVEAPGVLAGILRDVIEGTAKPMYRITETPDLTHAAVPAPDPAYLKKFVGRMGTMDTSRGCPFNCSFCTIINVQGRKMRCRSAKTILDSIEAHYELGFMNYFFTDDNFARSPIWKELFDGLKDMRSRGRLVEFMMQVDTQAWRIPGFIQGAVEAGCFLVYIGIETVNEENLKAADKRQNKVHQYAEMVDAWRSVGILVHGGVIIGFPHDTLESMRKGLAIFRDEIKVDEASYFMLTPLPGSRDHFEMVQRHVPLDADLNNYDSFHETFRHAHLKPGEWRGLYLEGWNGFYNKENLTNVLMRTHKDRYWRMIWVSFFNRYTTLRGVHMMISGFIRLKDRNSRRPIFPKENVAAYYWRRTKDLANEVAIMGKIFVEFQEMWLLTRPDGDPLRRTLGAVRETWGKARIRIHAAAEDPTPAEAIAEIRGALRAISGAFGALTPNNEDATGKSHPHPHKSHSSHKSHPRPTAVTGGATLRAQLEAMVREIAVYEGHLAKETPTDDTVLAAEVRVREILTAYENLAFADVARRRRCNRIHQELWERLKRGHIFAPRLALALPRALYDEVRLGYAFLRAFIHATTNRLRVA